MNAQIDKNLNNEFCLHNWLNRNDHYQTDFSLENSLLSLNIEFQKKKRKLWIYINQKKKKKKR